MSVFDEIAGIKPQILASELPDEIIATVTKVERSKKQETTQEHHN